MTVNLQGIIALAIAVLVGILIGYALVQGRLRRHRQALEESQQRLTDFEAAHEKRLRETTQRLQQDYQAELAATIEHYQDQLSDKTLQLQQTYETRFKVLQQGLTESPTVPPSAPEPPPAQVEPVEAAPAPTLSPPEVLQLKQQYEMRLKEAAHKLQQAYEKQLAQHAKAVRNELQQDYEKRLTEKIEHYDEQFVQRQNQLEQEFARRHDALLQAPPPPAPPSPDPTTIAIVNTPPATFTGVEPPSDGIEGFDAPPTAESMVGFDAPSTIGLEPSTASFNEPTPSEIMGVGRDETTVTLQPAAFASSSPLPPPPVIPPHLTEAAVNDRIQAATQAARKEYEAQIETKLKEYQNQLASRMQALDALEADYKQRLTALEPSSSAATDTPQAPSSSAPDRSDAAPPTGATGEHADTDDDDFEPLDLSDISQLT